MVILALLIEQFVKLSVRCPDRNSFSLIFKKKGSIGKSLTVVIKSDQETRRSGRRSVRVHRLFFRIFAAQDLAPVAALSRGFHPYQLS